MRLLGVKRHGTGSKLHLKTSVIPGVFKVQKKKTKCVARKFCVHASAGEPRRHVSARATSIQHLTFALSGIGITVEANDISACSPSSPQGPPDLKGNALAVALVSIVVRIWILKNELYCCSPQFLAASLRDKEGEYCGIYTTQTDVASFHILKRQGM